MTALDQLKNEGRAEGEKHGFFAGAIRGIQTALGMKPVSKRTLLSKTLEELQEMFDALVANRPQLARAL